VASVACRANLISFRRCTVAKRKGFSLSAPKTATWLICLVLGVVALLGSIAKVGVLADYSFWLLAVAWALLILATALQGL